jgi:hypothetical protein
MQLLLKDQQPGNCDFQTEVDFLKQTMEIATRHNLLMTVGNNSRDCRAPMFQHTQRHPEIKLIHQARSNILDLFGRWFILLVATYCTVAIAKLII